MLFKTFSKKKVCIIVIYQVDWKSGDRKPWRYEHDTMCEVQLTLACLDIENTTQAEKIV
jgi:hypothetical protein